MKNKTILWIAGIGVLLLILGILGKEIGLYSSISIARDCDYALDYKTHGAGEGECFVYTLNNVKSLAYVQSVSEKTRSCSISPSCPDGVSYTCSIDYCQSCWDLIFTCDYAKDSTGLVKVCKYDSDCPSNNCVNAMCKEGLPRECDTYGEIRCSSTTTYQTCLSSGKYSGILICPSGTICDDEVGCTASPRIKICEMGDEKCQGTILSICKDEYSWETKGQVDGKCGYTTGDNIDDDTNTDNEDNDDTNTDNEDNDDTNNLPIDTNTLLIIGIGVLAFVLILSAIKK